MNFEHEFSLTNIYEDGKVSNINYDDEDYSDSDMDNIDNLSVYHKNVNYDNSDEEYWNYVYGAKTFKPFSREKEYELGIRIQNGDEDAFHKLVLGNLNFVIKIANKYKHTGIPYEDLLAYGNIGLLIAAKKFDPKRNTKFITYAVYWIKQSILQLFINEANYIKLPLKERKMVYFLNKMRHKFYSKHGRLPQPEELCGLANISTEILDTYNQLGANTVFSFESPVYTSDISSNSREMLLSECIADEKNNTEEDYQKKEAVSKIQTVLSEVLTPREQYIVSYRYGLGGVKIKTLEELANELHITRERVRQLEKDSIKRLQLSEKAACLMDYM